MWFPLHQVPRVDKLTEAESEIKITRSWGREEGELVLTSREFMLGMM